jgi:hypothetical protein
MWPSAVTEPASAAARSRPLRTRCQRESGADDVAKHRHGVFTLRRRAAAMTVLKAARSAAARTNPIRAVAGTATSTVVAASAMATVTAVVEARPRLRSSAGTNVRTASVNSPNAERRRALPMADTAKTVPTMQAQPIVG